MNVKKAEVDVFANKIMNANNTNSTLTAFTKNGEYKALTTRDRPDCVPYFEKDFFADSPEELDKTAKEIMEWDHGINGQVDLYPGHSDGGFMDMRCVAQTCARCGSMWATNST
jgi:hypothetical protein